MTRKNPLALVSAFSHETKRLSLLAIIALCGVSFTFATAILPFGQFSHQPWQAKYYYALIGDNGPADNWYAANFDDSAWGTIEGPISGTIEWPTTYPPLAYYATVWNANKSSYWVRRHFTINKTDKFFYVLYVTHDDNCEVYLNGVKIYNASNCLTYPDYKTYVLSGSALEALKDGENVLAAYVSDGGGGQAFMDFGLYGFSNLNDAIVESAIPINITNDGQYPWVLNGEAMENGNKGKANTTSVVTMSFNAIHKTELSFDYACYNSSNHSLEVIIDGVSRGSTTSSSYSTCRFYLDTGSHVVQFKDNIGNSSSTSNWARVRNVRMRDIMPLETVVLADGTKPLTFVNDGEWPWSTEDGYIQSTNYGGYRSSRFSTHFTIDHISELSFDRRVTRYDNQYNSESYHFLRTYINGIQYQSDYNLTDFENYTITLAPGTYTVEWVDSTRNSYTYYSQIKNLRLVDVSSQYLVCHLSTAGTLNIEALDQISTLNDVKMLKVIGPMNAADWTTITYMKSLIAVDLGEASFTEVPANAFSGMGTLVSVILPEGVKTIGSNAFFNTSLSKITLPSSVESIASSAFYQCYKLESVTVKGNLSSIGSSAFQSCNNMKSFTIEGDLLSIGSYAFSSCSNLGKFIMPNTVTSIGSYAFAYCSNLKELWLSDALTSLPDYMAYEADLRVIHLPQNLQTIGNKTFDRNQHLQRVDFPASLSSIGDLAFSGCSELDSVKLPIRLSSLGDRAFYYNLALTYVELPSYLPSYNRNFENCTALQKVVCPSATPPAIGNDPFLNATDKGNVTLVVPAFALASYRYDNYWQQFTHLEEGEDVEYWKIATSLLLTNNRRMNGKPDIDILNGGQMTVEGNAPMEVGTLNFFISDANPGQLLNRCEAMAADNINTHYSVNRNTWYFFTPMHDVDLSKVSVSNGASYVFRYYDGNNRALNGTGASWKNVDNGKLAAGQGYIFQCNADAVITMPASASGLPQPLTAGDVTLPLADYVAASSANQSWNYVGNPYPTYYDIYYMDFTAPITVWTERTYRALSIVDDAFVLRPMQSFFVQKPASLGQIVFHQEGRQLSSTVDRPLAGGAAPRRTQTGRLVYDLTIKDENGEDETRVVVNENASAAYEIERDAAKFISFEAGVPQIYTLDGDGNGYAINERPLGDGEVALAYRSGLAGLHTIAVRRAAGEIWLLDHLEDRMVNLSEGDYTFYSNETYGMDAGRFTLLIGSGETDITEQVEAPSWDDAAYYDLQGRRVYSSDIKRGTYIIKGKHAVKKVSFK